MANLVVTSTTKSVKVDFNDLSESVGISVADFSKEHISEVKLSEGGYVEIVLSNNDTWNISHNGQENTLSVDSVDGVSVVSNEQMAGLIAGYIDY